MKQNRVLQQHARRLRREMTPTEKRLWSLLRGQQLGPFKFRRQEPIGPDIVDFYCARAALVVELDGESHLGKETADRNRQAALEAMGIKVIRFWDTEVYESQEAVLEVLWRECSERSGKVEGRLHGKNTLRPTTGQPATAEE
jgi:very-short-patch-repair endonuclease